MVPDGWTLGQVSDVCRFQNGYGFTPPVWDTQGLPIIRIQNLNGSKNFNYFSGKPDPKWIVEPGQMLFAWAGTKGASFGPTVWNGNTGVLNQHIFKVFEADGVHHDWLYLVLRHVTDRIETKAHGFKATLVHVKKSDIESQPIHIPPLQEQKKIADILSTWDRAIETTEALLATARTQKRALMQSLLTGKRRFPEFQGQEWKEVRLGDVADTRIGGTPARKEPSYWQGGQNTWLSIADLGPKYLTNSKEMISDTGVAKSNVKLLPGNTVVMSFKLTIGKLGITHVPLFTNEAICGFVPKSDDSFTPEFLFQLLHVADLLADVDQAVKGKTLNKAKLNELRLTLPVIQEQERIADLLMVADEEIENAETQIDKLRTEKKALMQQLLTGKRRVVV